MITKNGNVVILVKVSPYGMAEEKFMETLGELKSLFGIKKVSCQLGEIFGFKNERGIAYNQYELDFNDPEKFIEAMLLMLFLDGFFCGIEMSQDYEDNFEPVVISAIKKPT